MNYKLIKTDDYLLMIDNYGRDNVDGNWYYYYNHLFNIIGKNFDLTVYNDKFTSKVLAHLPINNVPYLDDLPILPPLDSNDSDDLDNLATQYDPRTKPDAELIRDAFKAGFKIAKEKFNIKHIDSYPNYFNCNIESLKENKQTLLIGTYEY